MAAETIVLLPLAAITIELETGNDKSSIAFLGGDAISLPRDPFRMLPRTDQNSRACCARVVEAGVCHRPVITWIIRSLQHRGSLPAYIARLGPLPIACSINVDSIRCLSRRRIVVVLDHSQHVSESVLLPVIIRDM